jgi:hypothetical protein
MIRIPSIHGCIAHFRWPTAIGILFAASCAHVEPPRGGPEDRIPPEVVLTRPEAGIVVPRYDGSVVFVFDERISERGVDEAVMVSPRTSPIEVRSGRDQVRVDLRRGWEPGHIYHVTLRQEISDLFGNQLAEPVTLVFSTGPEIPATEATGVVVDRVTGRPGSRIRVEAIRAADSLVYAIPTDVNGRFELTRIPEGEYQIRAFEDINRNRSLEYFEPRDSAFTEVRAGEAVDVSLRLLLPDSTPPVARAGTIRQREIRVEFDDYLDPEQEIDPGQVAVLDPSGVALPIEEVRTGTMPPPVTPAAPPARAPLGPPAAVQPETGPPPPPPILGPLPERSLVIELDEEAELKPETEYRVTVQGILNLNGLTGDAEVTVTTPAGAPQPPTPAAPAAAPGAPAPDVPATPPGDTPAPATPPDAAGPDAPEPAQTTPPADPPVPVPAPDAPPPGAPAPAPPAQPPAETPTPVPGPDAAG